jgi:hypothetical protein
VGFARDQPDPGFLWPVGSVGACRCLRRRSAGLDEREYAKHSATASLTFVLGSPVRIHGVRASHEFTHRRRRARQPRRLYLAPQHRDGTTG